MKVEFKDVYELLKREVAYYQSEIERREWEHYDPVQKDVILYLKGQKRAIEMAIERLDLELNYGLGVGGDDE